MRADTAAAYVDEASVETFRRRVGSIYPEAIPILGRGDVWLKDHLDQAIDRISGSSKAVRDAADEL